MTTNFEPPVPAAFLFQLAAGVLRKDGLPGPGKELCPLSSEHRLPSSASLDEDANHSNVLVAWNEEGLGFRFDVGANPDAASHAGTARTENTIDLWFDTRPGGSTHRAGRYCRRLQLEITKRNSSKPMVSVEHVPIEQARDTGVATPLNEARTQITKQKDRYTLDLWLPASVLQGFDPETTRQLGFHYEIRDGKFGIQTPQASGDLGYDRDPTLWMQLTMED
ncbi:DOMON domain-containing protein [Calycomorphotria hydatis]|uniref:Carbohydrate-binding domain-containing protein n=1 Tax=Calycomorphotria hydatis TaxID=2528027 RepID=A0A517T5W4_9PLAN|nr:hypothetical protein [Calycomorphotria hydatis]QDT63772.1 hypothetical protein V22_09970 [Calycomorphotria hydatis]